MLSAIISFLSNLITGTIDHLGYGGVLLLMALESCNIPIPSEVILPYAGFLVSQGQMNLHLAALVGGLACLLGSIASYWLGLKLGRPFLWKHGKWLLISRSDIIRADKFMAKYGSWSFFLSRLLPIIRTFFSFVAGISRGNFWKFCLYTFLGSWIWSYALIFFGQKLGERWQDIAPAWEKYQEIIIALIVLAVVWHIYRVVRDNKKITD
ncbi:MAG TPA: DedA family protein [bacterium]|nr:DedA family protein [bacterium]HPT29545.1 DedA family protein [bacterium]